jgi:transcriptional regulator NrdR family protein
MGRISKYDLEPLFGICRKCGDQVECIDSRALRTYRRRRHRCTNYKCGFRYTTHEVYIEDWKDMEEASNQAKSLLRVVREAVLSSTSNIY